MNTMHRIDLKNQTSEMFDRFETHMESKCTSKVISEIQRCSEHDENIDPCNDHRNAHEGVVAQALCEEKLAHEVQSICEGRLVKKLSFAAGMCSELCR